MIVDVKEVFLRVGVGWKAMGEAVDILRSYGYWRLSDYLSASLVFVIDTAKSASYSAK